MRKFTLPKINFQLPFARHKQALSLGLDIGSFSVKICELAETDQGYKLLSLGSAKLPVGAVEDGVLQDPVAVSKVIAGLIRNLKIKGKKTAISISGYSVIVKKINLAVMTEAELEAHIQAEAEQYIPFDIDDVYLDFQDLKAHSADENRTEVMLVAAKKEVVNAYLAMLEGAGLQAVIVDVDAFALENAYGGNYGLEENVALVDIGSSKMSINIISRGTSILARDVVLGSRQLTEQIENRLGIDHEQAEAYKIGQTAAGAEQELLEEIFVATCTQWVLEVKKALDFYYSNYPNETINRLVLSGGGSRIKGLDLFFQEETGIVTELFNPFAKAEIDARKIDPEYVRYMAPEMAIATGLATRPAVF